MDYSVNYSYFSWLLEIFEILILPEVIDILLFIGLFGIIVFSIFLDIKYSFKFNMILKNIIRIMIY